MTRPEARSRAARPPCARTLAVFALLVAAPGALRAEEENRDGRAREGARLPAEILARHDVDVPAEVAGKVVRRPDDDTQAVEKGAVVVTLDDRILETVARGAEAALEQASARLEWARLESERAGRLRATGAVGEAEDDRARMQLREAAAARRAAEAALAEARERLARTRLRAPFAGRLVRIEREAGEYIRAGETAFRIVDDSAIRVIAYAPARVVGRLEVGQPVRVGAAYDDGTLGPAHAARLFAIAPAAEGRSRTFRVEARLDRPEDMRPGMAGYLELPPAPAKPTKGGQRDGGGKDRGGEARDGDASGGAGGR